MPRKRILSVGQCSADHWSISRTIEKRFLAEVVRRNLGRSGCHAPAASLRPGIGQPHLGQRWLERPGSCEARASRGKAPACASHAREQLRGSSAGGSGGRCGSRFWQRFPGPALNDGASKALPGTSRGGAGVLTGAKRRLTVVSGFGTPLHLIDPGFHFRERIATAFAVPACLGLSTIKT